MALLLFDAYQALRENDSLSQLTAVMTLGDLASEHAVPPLEAIAREEITSRADPDHHHAPELAHDRTIRMRAVDGLAKAASAGVTDAQRVLFEMARDRAYDEHRSIKIRAIRGFVGTGPDATERADRLRADLPPELHFALEPREELTQEKVAAVFEQLPE